MNMRGLFVAVALLGCSPAQPTARPPLEGARIGAPFALTDQTGQRITDAAFAGRYRIMYFGYTFCPDVCPVDMQKIGAALKLLDTADPALARRIAAVFVTIDPARDTPAVLKQFVSAFDPRITGLTGTPAEIARTARDFGIYFARGKEGQGGYLMDHSRQVYLMDPAGKPLALLPTEGTPQQIVDEIRRWAT